MNYVDMLLRILTASNAATPAILAIIQSIRGGAAAGKTDEEIEAESMQVALDTQAQTKADEGSQP